MKNRSLWSRTAAAVCAFIFVQWIPASALAQATVTTDREDYAPFSDVVITGRGFGTNEAVTVRIDELFAGGLETFVAGWSDTTTDDSGNFTTIWYIWGDDFIGSTLRATATGQSSGVSAMTVFTDGPPPTGIAPVSPPVGGFGIDGDLKANATSGDWLPGPAGSQGAVLNNDGSAVDSTTTFHITDPYDGDDDVFGGGDKVNADPNTWGWTRKPGGAGNKVDLNNALVHLTTNPGNHHQWVVVSGDRMSDNGTAYIDFEFLQNTLTLTNNTGGTNGGFASAGPHGGRTVNDFILTVALVNGGSTASFYLVQWKPKPGGGYDYFDATANLPIGSWFAAVNPTNGTPVPYGAFGTNIYLKNTFAEAAVDMTALLGAITSDPCIGMQVKTVLVKTKESDSTSANIADLINPIQINLKLGLADAGSGQAQCADPSGTTTFNLTGTAHPNINAVTNMSWSVVSGNATITSGNACNNCTTLPATVAVTGAPATATLRLTIKDAAGCTQTDEVTLTVKPLPPCEITGPNGPLCPNSTDHTYTGPSGMDTYSWTISGGGTIVGANTGPSVSVKVSANCNTNFTLALTVTKDGCSSLSGCNKTVAVQDTTAPLPLATPADVSVQCSADVPSPVDLTASDTCSGSITVSPVDSAPVADAQGCGYTITRTWTFTDNCGNSSSASQSIHVKDTIAPVAPDAPAAANVQCAGDIPAGVQLTAQDNCSGSITVSPVDGAPVADAQGCGHTITRTWTFTDNCGNSSSASQSIHVKDTIAPVAPDAPAAANVQCAGDIPAALQLTAQDNCSGSITVSPVDSAPVADAQGCGHTITRIWTFTDNCGNRSSASQSIHVKDTIAPVAPDAPAAANVQCAGDIPAAVQLTAQDNCSGSITVSPVDSAPVPDAEGCGYTITRTWTFTDACGNSSSASQSIHVKDTTAPVAPDAPAAANVQCASDISAAVQLAAQDNCSGSITVSPVDSAPVPDAQGCGYTLTRTWTFTDNCGNSSSASQSIHVKDTIAPVAPDAPAAANVQCEGDIPAAVQLTAQDNCSGSITVSPVDSAPVADAQGCGYTITRTWNFTDACGNRSSASQNIHVKDTIAPVAPDAPAAANAQCAGDIPAGVQLAAQDNCSGSITVSPVDSAPVADAQGCGYTITRTWTFTDNCGNSSSVSQSIHVKDTTAPVAPDAPTAANVQCAGDIPAGVQLTAQDNCSGSITVSPVESAPVADAQGCGYTITRTWTFTDNCGNSSSVSQSIHVKDTTAPVAPDAPTAANVQCAGDIPAGVQLTAQDNCSGSITVSPVESAPVADAQGCGYTITRTWTFTDNCGNSSSVSQSIHVKDTTAPVPPNAPAAANVQCAGDIPAAVQLTAQDTCSGSITVSPVDGAPVADAQGCGYTITRTWTFTDNCGNSSSASQSIHVKDTTAPVPPNAPAAANVQCAGDIPAAVQLTAQDTCSGSITVSPVDGAPVADAQGCGYTITRTWTFTDNCGNSSSASQSIHVKDTIAPVAPDAPAAANVQCAGDIPAAVQLTAQDNCSGSITVSPVDGAPVADAQGCGNTITRTWTFTDNCGNSSSVSQSIYVKDTIAPVAPDAPAAANVQCEGGVPAALQLTAQDNCSGSITVSPVDSAPVPDAQGCGATFERTWTFTDACGNSSSVSQSIHVKELIVLVAPDAPAAANVQCTGDIPAAVQLTAQNNCSGSITVSPVDSAPVADAQGCGYTITRTWTFTDACGNSSSASQSIHVKDTTAPVAPDAPAAANVQCAGDIPAALQLTAQDNCSGSITVSPVDSAPVADAQGCGYTITRTWTFTDNCGNSSSASQSIHVKDTTAPVAPDAPAAANVQCAGDIPAAVQLTAQDNCSGSITVSPVEGAPVPDAQGCGYTITRTWTFTDNCGNSSSASQSIHVKDTTAPVAPDAPAAANGQCAGGIPAGVQLTAQDNCSGSITVSPVDSAPVADAEGCGYTITRTWTFTDNCGNSSSASQSIHVKDTIAPVAPDAPAAANVQCAGEIPAAVQLTAQDNCSGSITVSPVDGAPVADAQGCGNTITRTWTFTDNCGNSSSVSQSIYVKDTIAPVAPDAPAAANVQCEGGVPAALQLTAQDNCSGSITVSPVDSAPVPDAQGCGATFERTWAFTDACGNSSSVSQSIHVKELIVLVAPDAPAAANAQCTGDIPAAVQLTAQNNCSGSITVSPVDSAPVADAQGCGYTITRTWTFTDACGNSSSASQSIHVKDTTAPVAPDAPAAANVQCAGDIPAALQLTAQDNCSGSITVSPVDSAPVADAQGCGYSFTRTWTFTDNCGNSSSASQSIHVKDTTAPVAPDAPAAANVQCAGDIPAGVQLTAQDNCSGSITVSPVEGAPVPDAQGCGYTITRTWTFTDNCGNSSSASQSIHVKDTIAPVAPDAPAAANVQCAGDIPAAVQLTAQDNCSGSITVSPVDGAPVADAQGCGNTITRTWTFTDNCGNSSSVSQSIYVKDTIAPVAPDAPAAANVQCEGGVPAALQLTAQDNCSGSITVSPVDSAPVPDAQGCGATFERTWTFTDACGNSSSVSQSIHVKELIVLVAPDAPAAANVQCTGDIPAAVQLTAQNNCSGSITVSPVDSAPVADAQGCGYTITRTWTFTDACGNSSSASQSIHVKDTTAPVAPDAPAAANVQCAGDIPAALQLTAQDNCSGSITVSPVDSAPVADAQGCGYSFTRTWTFTDNCGNSSSASQSIHVKDTTAPVAPDAPAAANVQCAGDIPAAVQLTAQDNCSGSITVSPVEGVPVPDAQGCGHTITRTWTFTDNCGNRSSASQSIHVKDTIAPVAPNAPAAANVQCAGDIPAAVQLTAQDNCSGSITVWPVDSAPVADAQGCGYSFTRTWTFTDACGNSSSASQNIVFADTQAPIAMSSSASAVIECSATPQFTTPAFWDHCDSNPAVTQTDSTSTNALGQTVYTRTWTCTDACSNSTTCAQSLTAATCGGNVCVVKFFDANTDGIQNNGELGIAGWKFTLTGGPTNITLVGYTGNDGSFCFPTVGPGTYTVTEATAKQSSWFNTTPKSRVVTVAGSAVTKQFGNVCIGWGGADGTPGFWSNKNGETLLNDGPDGANPEMSMLASLYLRNAKGANFDPKKYAEFKTWLQGADAVNAAYALSKHLAAMELNVEARMRNGNALIYAPGAVGANAQGFATLNTLMNEANTLLGKKGSIPSGDSDRAYALALKDALANGNVSSNFVQASPCPFTF